MELTEVPMAGHPDSRPRVPAQLSQPRCPQLAFLGRALPDSPILREGRLEGSVALWWRQGTQGQGNLAANASSTT